MPTITAAEERPHHRDVAIVRLGVTSKKAGLNSRARSTVAHRAYHIAFNVPFTRRDAPAKLALYGDTLPNTANHSAILHHSSVTFAWAPEDRPLLVSKWGGSMGRPIFFGRRHPTMQPNSSDPLKLRGMSPRRKAEASFTSHARD